MAEVSRYIAAPPRGVFAVLADGWTYSQWVVGTSHVRAVDLAWPQPGSRLYHASGVWPVVVRDFTEVRAMVPDQRLSLMARGYPLGRADIDLTLQAEQDGTRVVLHEVPSGPAALLLRNPVVDAVIGRRNTEALARLDALVERPTRPPDDQ